MTTFSNQGKLTIKDCGLDGLHIANGAHFENHGEIISEGNGRHGVYVAGEAVKALQQDMEQVAEFLGMASLSELRQKLMPLVSGVKDELAKPQPDSSFIKKGLTTMKDFLAKAAGSAAGTMALAGLRQLVEHADKIVAHL